MEGVESMNLNQHGDNWRHIVNVVMKHCAELAGKPEAFKQVFCTVWLMLIGWL
jgi:hypothetical protein